MRRKERGLFTAMLAGGARSVEERPEPQPQPQGDTEVALPIPARIQPRGTGIFSGILGPGGEAIREQQAEAAAVKAAEQAAAKSGVFTVAKPVHPELLNRTRQFFPLAQNTLRFPEPGEREPVPPEPVPQREFRAEPEPTPSLKERLAQRLQPPIGRGQRRTKELARLVDPVVIVDAHGGQFVMINDPALREQFANSKVGREMPARGALFGQEGNQRLEPLRPDDARRLKRYIEKL